MDTNLKDNGFVDLIDQFLAVTGLDPDNIASWYIRGQSTEGVKYNAGLFISVLLKKPVLQLQWIDNEWQHYRNGGYVTYEHV